MPLEEQSAIPGVFGEGEGLDVFVLDALTQGSPELEATRDVGRCVDILAAGISRGSLEVRRQALRSSLRLFQQLDDQYEYFYTDSLLSVCVGALNDDDVLTKQYAAHLLSVLTTAEGSEPTSERLKCMMKHGAVPALLRYAGSATGEAKQHALDTVCVILANADWDACDEAVQIDALNALGLFLKNWDKADAALYCKRMLDMGLLQALIACFQAGDKNIQLLTLYPIARWLQACKLTRKASCQAITASGAIPVLLEHCVSGKRDRNALWVLDFLVDDDNECLDSHVEEVVPILIANVESGHRWTEVRSVSILDALVRRQSSIGYPDLMLQGNAVPALLKIIGEASNHAYQLRGLCVINSIFSYADWGACDEAVQIGALEALRVFLENLKEVDAKSFFRCRGVLQTLIACFQSGNEHIQLLALHSIAYWLHMSDATRKASCQAILASDAMPVLLAHCMGEKKDINALRVLFFLVKDDNECLDSHAEEVVSALTANLALDDTRTKACSVFILGGLARSKNGIRFCDLMLQGNAVPALLKTVDETLNDFVQQSALSTIKLIFSNANWGACDDEIKLQALKALRNFLRNLKETRTIAPCWNQFDAGMMRGLMSCLQSDNEDVLSCTLGTIRAWFDWGEKTLKASCQEIVASDDAMPVLLKCCASTVEGCRLQLSALAVLDQLIFFDHKCLDSSVEVVPVLLANIESENRGLKYHTIRILYNLTLDQDSGATRHHDLLRQAIVPRLLKSVEKLDERIKDEGYVIIHRGFLLANDKEKPAILDALAGLIEGFDAAIARKKIPSERMASILIVFLESDHARYQLLAERALLDLVKRMHDSACDEKDNCLMMICRLINGTNSGRQVVIDMIKGFEALPNLLIFLKNRSFTCEKDAKSEQCRTIAVDTLLKLARSEVSREACYKVVFDNADGLSHVNTMLRGRLFREGLQLLHSLLMVEPRNKSVMQLYNNVALSEQISLLAKREEVDACAIMDIMAIEIRSSGEYNSGLTVLPTLTEAVAAAEAAVPETASATGAAL